MEKAEHVSIHKALHTNLDVLVADMITHTKNLNLKKMSVMDLIAWSHKQCNEETVEE